MEDIGVKKAIAIIPARYDSSRFPGKPLALIAGKPMIQRVYEQARKASCIEDVYVATDDERIRDCVKGFGGNVLMTSKNHASGTDRLAECVDILNLEDDYVVLNIQGDEPLIKPEMIEELSETLQDNADVMGTLCERISDEKDLNNPNIVKVVADKDQYAIYFSRSPIPYKRVSDDSFYYCRHIGIYAYRADFLKKFTSMEKGTLEKIESLEQLRAIENGFKIKLKETKYFSYGVDVPEQIEEIETIMRESGIR